MAKAGQNTIVPQTCGVGVSGIFRKNSEYTGTQPTIAEMANVGGAGWHMAGFTNTPEDNAPTYKQAYKELKVKWKIIYQSPVRTNTRTNHPFFFCLYDTTKKVFKVNNAQYDWPEEF